jgi:enamine deaminase RidA (YjgF/YER057c/UK114 family)
MRKLISTGSPWETKAGYSRAVIANDTIYISGTSGHRPDVGVEAIAVHARPR